MLNATLRLLLTLAGGAVVLSASSGCSTTPATPQATITSALKPASGSAGVCPAGADAFWQIGGTDGTPVKDADTQTGAAVSVTCSVTGNDQAGYTITAQAALNGQGAVSIQGHVDGTANPQTTIKGTFAESNGLGTYSETDCTVTFTGPNNGIAAGRVWGHLSCPKANNPDRTNAICDAESDFRFENCAQ